MPVSHLQQNRCDSYIYGNLLDYFLPRMRSPRYRVYRTLMTWERTHWKHRHTNIKNDNLSSIHHDGSYIIRVLLIPCHSNQGRWVITLVNNGWVFQVSQIKVPYWPILSSWGKHTNILSEADIIDCFVMSNQLSLNYFLFNVPNCARCVYTWGAYHFNVFCIPVKAGNRSAIFWVLSL